MWGTGDIGRYVVGAKKFRGLRDEDTGLSTLRVNKMPGLLDVVDLHRLVDGQRGVADRGAFGWRAIAVKSPPEHWIV